jgi:murein DD-endopeptidase MepM/ murein hydrolase activator NlpD
MRRLPWFVAGVGIPLICIALITSSNVTENTQPAPASLDTNIDAEAVPASAGETILAAANASELTAAVAPAPLPGTELTMTVRRGDSLDRLFKRNNLSRTDLANIMDLKIARQHLRLIKPGDRIIVRQDKGRILRLDRTISISEVLSVRQGPDGFTAETLRETLESRPARATGTIRSSLFLAAAEAGISDRTIMNLAGIFAWDVDFMLDIRQGDQFTVVYEEVWKDGERVAEGNILAAEFINQGESFRAIRFEDAGGRIDYFTPDGNSVRKAFLRAPLTFSRISSNFNPRRRHPKLNTIRAHKGVDYAAATGTPIKAAGDGKIIHRGRKGSYGNAVILQHGGNITTLYAHMSRFSRSRIGTRVLQGDIIGYVGSTGLATGPHLHYEYRRNGVHLNPRTVKLPDAEPLRQDYVADFQRAAVPLLQQLDATHTLLADTST